MKVVDLIRQIVEGGVALIIITVRYRPHLVLNGESNRESTYSYISTHKKTKKRSNIRKECNVDD